MGRTSDGKVDVIDSSSQDIDADDGSRVPSEVLESHETRRNHESNVAELDLTYDVAQSSVRESEESGKGRGLTERSVDDDGSVSSEHECRSVRRRQISRELRERTANRFIINVLPPRSWTQELTGAHRKTVRQSTVREGAPTRSFPSFHPR